MDKNEAQTIARAIDEAAASILEAHGLKRARMSTRYGDGEIKVTLTAEAQGDESPAVRDWHRYAEAYGLPVDALGRTITINGKPVTITGLVVRRRKYPVQTETARGKKMLYTIDGVLGALARADVLS